MSSRPLTPDAITIIRSWISDKTPPTDDDLSARYAVLGNLRAVVREQLRKQLATFVADPAQLRVEGGEYEQNVSANIKALQDQIVLLRQQPIDLGLSGGNAGIPVQRIVRPSTRGQIGRCDVF